MLSLRRLEEGLVIKKHVSTYPSWLLASLKTAVSEFSQADGNSINQFVTTAVAEKVCAIRTAEVLTERASQADIAAEWCLSRRGGERAEPEDSVR